MRHAMMLLALPIVVAISSSAASQPQSAITSVTGKRDLPNRLSAGDIVSVQRLRRSPASDLDLDAVLIRLSSGQVMAMHRTLPAMNGISYSWGVDDVAGTYTANLIESPAQQRDVRLNGESLQPEGGDGTGLEGTENDPNYNVSGGSDAYGQKWEFRSSSVIISQGGLFGLHPNQWATMTGEMQWLQCRNGSTTTRTLLKGQGIATAHDTIGQKTRVIDATYAVTDKTDSEVEVQWIGRYSYDYDGKGVLEQYFFQKISDYPDAYLGGFTYTPGTVSAHLEQQIYKFIPHKLADNVSGCNDTRSSGEGGDLEFSWGMTTPDATTSAGGTTCQPVKNGTTGETLGTCCGASTEDIVGCALDLLEGANG